MTAPQIIEIGGVLRGLAKTLPKPSHASDDAVSVFVAALAAKTDHAFDTMGIDPQRFGGMAMFTRFGKLLEKVAAQPCDADFRGPNGDWVGSYDEVPQHRNEGQWVDVNLVVKYVKAGTEDAHQCVPDGTRVWQFP